MKKALIFLAMIFVGCGDPGKVSTPQTGKRFKIYNLMIEARVIVVDGCEYLYLPSGNASWCTHKGNCNNPIHLAK